MKIPRKLAPTWLDVEFDGEKIGFFCRPLTEGEKITLMQLVEDGEIGEAMVRTIRYACRDWRNVVDEKGEPVPFSEERLREFFGTGAYTAQVMALAGMVQHRAALSETDRTKS